MQWKQIKTGVKLFAPSEIRSLVRITIAKPKWRFVNMTYIGGYCGTDGLLSCCYLKYKLITYLSHRQQFVHISTRWPRLQARKALFVKSTVPKPLKRTISMQSPCIKQPCIRKCVWEGEFQWGLTIWKNFLTRFWFYVLVVSDSLK